MLVSPDGRIVPIHHLKVIPPPQAGQDYQHYHQHYLAMIQINMYFHRSISFIFFVRINPNLRLYRFHVRINPNPQP
jgi:hypothetical protein